MNDIQELSNQIGAFQGIQLAQLKRDDLGPYNFETVFSKITVANEQLRYLAANIETLEQSPIISQSDINIVANKFTRFNTVANEILRFETASSDPNPRKESVVNQVISMHAEVIQELKPIILAVRSELQNADAHVAAVQAKELEISALLKELKQKSEEASEAVQAIKKLSAVGGAKSFSSVFKTQARGHCIASRWWGGASIVLFVVLLSYTIWLVFGLPPLSESASIAVAVREVAIHILLLSVMSFALIQAVKNYNTNKHLQVVNEHRQNSMDTFETFVNAAEGDVRNAVLLQATKSIFENVKTGFLAKDVGSTFTFSAGDILKKLSGE